MSRTHHYHCHTEWTGNKGNGTSNYTSYERSHTISIKGKPEILSSSDQAFRGDPLKYNPEELLLASLSSCHMLWYLHLCAEAGVVVTAYLDHATAVMKEHAETGGKFVEACLHPKVTIDDHSMTQQALALHHKANKLCYIANSVNFPVSHQAEVIV